MDRRDWQHLAVAVVVGVLLVGCYWFMTAIHRGGQLETCLARRQPNCEQYR